MNCTDLKTYASDIVPGFAAWHICYLAFSALNFKANIDQNISSHLANILLNCLHKKIWQILDPWRDSPSVGSRTLSKATEQCPWSKFFILNYWSFFTSSKLYLRKNFWEQKAQRGNSPLENPAIAISWPVSEILTSI